MPGEKDYFAYSLSGGKDSSALLLLALEKGLPIDSVIYAATGMDFPELEAHIDKLDELLFRERGIHITRLRTAHTFEWFMFEEPKTRPATIGNRTKLGIPLCGNGWPGTPQNHQILRGEDEPRSGRAGEERAGEIAECATTRCTGQLKTHLINKEVNRLKTDKNAVQVVGIAADETRRCKDDPRVRYPLVEWGVTEAQALRTCYDRGYDFGGLYEIYNRASCWCCPFQRVGELRKLRRHHPELWARLLELDRRAHEQFGDTPLGVFRQNWPVARYEARFAKEDENAGNIT